jgi:quinol monooxygenase YgiN
MVIDQLPFAQVIDQLLIQMPIRTYGTTLNSLHVPWRTTMSTVAEPLAEYLAESSKSGDEISVTGKWTPTKSRMFGKSTESKQTVTELENILTNAKSEPGVLAMELDPTVGGDSFLVHQVFKDPESLVAYFSSTASHSVSTLLKVARPDLQLVRGADLPTTVVDAIKDKGIPAVFGKHIFGFVKNNYVAPDPKTAIDVTAKWTCKPGETSQLENLKYWWQRVGTDAFSMEEGLLRFEVFEAIGEDALIIHETFEDTAVLKFHLMKGTAKIYKSDIDKVAEAERYVFRGPVLWLIRTYSKVLRLPATYSNRGDRHSLSGGNMSDGTTE